MMFSMIVIAIDGPSGSGKGTIAGYLASIFNLAHIDSGLVYRQAGLYALDRGLDPLNLTHEDEKNLVDFIEHIQVALLDSDPRLRLEGTANVASKLAALPWIRLAATTWLRTQTRSITEGTKGYVVDGRDTTTAVFPHADIKFYVTADETTRFQRRAQETLENPKAITQHMTERDHRDTTRKIDPLSITEGAFVIDTTHLSIDEACQNASQYVTERCFSNNLEEQ
jgi:cytidylate kinase